MTTTQLTGRLLRGRLKPAPAWNCVAVDLFGPYRIRGDVQKRITGKAYGVIFNCLGKFNSYFVLFTCFEIYLFTVLLMQYVDVRASLFHFFVSTLLL